MKHEPEFCLALLHPRHWSMWAVTGLLWSLALLPWSLRGSFADAAAAVYRRVPGRRLHFTMANLRRCYPAESEQDLERLVRDSFRVLAHMYAHLGVLMFGPPHRIVERVEVQGSEVLDGAGTNERPIILFTPHWLSGEFAQHAIAAMHPIACLVRVNTKDRLLDWMVTRMRRRAGGEMYSVQSPLIGAVRAVRNGRWLLYGPDEDAGAIPHEFVPFFGIPKATAPTLGRLASLCGGAVVIPLTMTYCPDRCHFTLTFHQRMGELSPLAMNRRLEELIRIDPEQYTWFTKLYKTQPRSAQSQNTLARHGQEAGREVT